MMRASTGIGIAAGVGGVAALVTGILFIQNKNAAERCFVNFVNSKAGQALPQLPQGFSGLAAPDAFLPTTCIPPAQTADTMKKAFIASAIVTGVATAGAVGLRVAGR